MCIDESLVRVEYTIVQEWIRADRMHNKHSWLTLISYLSHIRPDMYMSEFL
jgi:hypothetical protein